MKLKFKTNEQTRLNEQTTSLNKHKGFVRKHRREILKRVLTKQNEPGIEETLNSATDYWNTPDDSALFNLTGALK